MDDTDRHQDGDTNDNITSDTNDNNITIDNNNDNITSDTNDNNITIDNNTDTITKDTNDNSFLEHNANSVIMENENVEMTDQVEDPSLVSEIACHTILHWNYRSYPRLPQELLTHGGHIQAGGTIE